jgi:DNA polymerase-3 subunit epsilon
MSIFRSSMLREFSAIPFMIAGKPNAQGGWDIQAFTHGRFAGAIQAPVGHNPKSYIEQLRITCATDVSLPTLVAEIELNLKWLGDGLTRLVEISPGFSWSHPLAAPQASSANSARLAS